MSGNLSNKVAVITGASSGIGRATARLFADRGAKVVVVCRHSEKGIETVERIEANHGQASLVLGDVAKESQVQSMVQKIMTQYGRLDILVNNAGIYREGDVLNITAEDWQSVLATNLTGVFFFA